jgi:hypothetical protein
VPLRRLLLLPVAADADAWAPSTTPTQLTVLATPKLTPVLTVLALLETGVA